MIQVLLFHPDGRVERGGAELIDAPCAEGSCLWIDLEGQTPENQALVEGIGFHPLAVEDTFTLDHQPKVEEYDDCLFVIVRGINFNQRSDRLETLKLAAFLAADRLVTYHRQPLRSVATVRTRIEESGRSPRGGLPHLLYLIYDEMMGHYFPVLEEIAAAIEEVEEEIFDEPQPHHLETILRLRRRLSTLRRVMLPHRQIFSHLASGGPVLIPAHEALYFRDVYDEVFRLADAVDQQRDQLSSVRDTYLSVVSQRTNDVMKVLTIISAVLLPLSVIAGIYGMNFANMPELQSRWGYPMVLGLMAIIAGGLVTLFRRKGWL